MFLFEGVAVTVISSSHVKNKPKLFKKFGII